MAVHTGHSSEALHPAVGTATNNLQRHASAAAQAGTTDNTPVYVLGGNIVPIGVNGTNTTSGAQSGPGSTPWHGEALLQGNGSPERCMHAWPGNLTLLIALPDGQSPGFQRCGQLCAATSSEGNLVACGHMYLDGGALLHTIPFHGCACHGYPAAPARRLCQQ